jgi:predicted O-methyltransferase YrrM
VDFERAWTQAETIEGWLTRGQARMLFDAAAQTRAGETIVEIGSHQGRSTVILASAKPPGVNMVAVDPFEDVRWGGGPGAIDIFDGNLRAAGLRNEVTLVRRYGAEAGRAWSDGPVGMLFLDGAHDYSTVVSDLTAWLTHLSPNAAVLMHDAYSAPGVTRAAFRFMFGHPTFVYASSSGSLVRFQRASARRPLSRLVSAMRMFARLAWLARNLAVKAAMMRGWRLVPRLLGHSDSIYPY